MDTLTQIFLRALEISLTAAIAAAIILLVRLILAKRIPRRASYALWGLVLVRLLLPVSLPSPTSLYNHTVYTPQSIIQAQVEIPEVKPEFPSVWAEPKEPSYEASAPELPSESLSSTPTESSAPQESAPAQIEAPAVKTPQKSWTVTEILAVTWVVVASILLVTAAAIYVSLRCSYRTAWLYSNQDLFDRCNRTLRRPFRKKIPIFVSPKATSPMAVGFFRPRVILPAGKFPQDQAVCMVLHELIHIRRGDQIMRLLSIALVCIHWFNPLLWIALRFSSKDMELSCDEAVLARLGERSAGTYASALVDLSVRQHRLLNPMLLFGESNIKQRVKNALSYKKPALWVSLAAVALLIAGSVVLLTDPVHTEIQAGDSLEANLAGISVRTSADNTTASLLESDDWTKLDEVPELPDDAVLEISFGDKKISFSQLDPVAVIEKDGTAVGYEVPLGTEENLRAELLEASKEFAALPPAQQELLSGLMNAEHLWGCWEYPQYFAVSPEFAAQLANALLTPGNVIDPPEAAQYPDITLYLVYPRGKSMLGISTYEGRTMISDGVNNAVLLDASVHEEISRAMWELPQAEFSATVYDENAPGFTAVDVGEEGLFGSSWIVKDWLVSVTFEDGIVLSIHDLETGALLRRENLDGTYVSQLDTIRSVRACGDPTYDVEVSGALQDSTLFVWQLTAEQGGESRLETGFPDFWVKPEISTQMDATLWPKPDSVRYDGDSVRVEYGNDWQDICYDTINIREYFIEHNLPYSLYDGMNNVAFLNEGNTIAADLTMKEYPFTNGLFLAVRNESEWNTRIIPGSSRFVQGELLNSFYRELSDGTIAYCYLEESGWTAEFIDPNTLETIRTLDFGGYSYEYLSLEGMAPRSMSGDNFYAPRLTIRFLDRDTLVVVDSCYKISGQRVYLLDLNEKLLSDPAELNGRLLQASSDYLLTAIDNETPGTDHADLIRTLWTFPVERLRETLHQAQLRPVISREEQPLAEADETLVALLNEGLYLEKRGENLTASVSQMGDWGAPLMNPLSWTPCDSSVLSEGQLADYTDGSTLWVETIAAVNLYGIENGIVMELLPDSADDPFLYYQTDKITMDSLDSAMEQFGEAFWTSREPEYQLGQDVYLAAANNRYDIIDLARRKYGLHLVYDWNMVSGLAMGNDVLIVSVSTGNPVGEPREYTVDGRTFYETGDALVEIYNGSQLLSLEEGQSLVTGEMLDEALNLLADRYPQFYRDETTYRIEQILNYAGETDPENGLPAADYFIQYYYRFQELVNEFKASDQWEPWLERLNAYLKEQEYVNYDPDPNYYQKLFFPGELVREALRDAWGDDAVLSENLAQGMTTYHPEEDIFEFGYGFGFSMISRKYPVSFQTEDDMLTVQYAELIIGGDGGGPHPLLADGDDYTWLGETWRSEPTLDEVTQRADELPLKTATFHKENGRWILQ